MSEENTTLGDDTSTPYEPAKDWYDFVPPKSSHTAALYFNLTDPEGERKLRECLDAIKWKCAVWEFERWLRVSSEDDRHDPEWNSALDHALEKLFEFFEGEGINLLDE